MSVVETKGYSKRELLLNSTLTPGTMANVFSGGEWEWAHHLVTLDKALVQLANREIKRLLVMMPPRHGKSEMISKWFPRWYFTRFPKHSIILSSYAAEFASNWGQHTRQFFKQFGHELGNTVTSGSANNWSLLSGGSMKTAGVGGPITGRGANLAIIDDPIKNSEEALSPVIRQKHKDWYQSTLRSRIEPDGDGNDGVLAVLMTHWHQDDLAGFIVDTEAKDYDWTIIKFPAIDVVPVEATSPGGTTPSSPSGRNQNVALWPQRWPLRLLEPLRDTMDPMWWSLLYQQEDPADGGRNHWPAHYFKDIYIDAIPVTRLHRPQIVALDATDKGSDNSAIIYMKIVGGTAYIQAEISQIPPELAIDKAVQKCSETGCQNLIIEGQTLSSLVRGEVERSINRHRAVIRNASIIQNYIEKETRIMRLGSYLARKQIKIVRDLGGRELVKEMQEFPNGTFDDGPDALEMALRYLPEQELGPHTVDQLIQT